MKANRYKLWNTSSHSEHMLKCDEANSEPLKKSRGVVKSTSMLLFSAPFSVNIEMERFYWCIHFYILTVVCSTWECYRLTVRMDVHDKIIAYGCSFFPSWTIDCSLTLSNILTQSKMSAEKCIWMNNFKRLQFGFLRNDFFIRVF